MIVGRKATGLNCLDSRVAELTTLVMAVGKGNPVFYCQLQGNVIDLRDARKTK